MTQGKGGTKQPGWKEEKSPEVGQVLEADEAAQGAVLQVPQERLQGLPASLGRGAPWRPEASHSP